MLKGKVYISAAAMITSLGEGVQRNMDAVLRGESGVKLCTDQRVTQSSVMAGIIPEAVYTALRAKYGEEYTRAELLAAECVKNVYAGAPDGRTLMIIASAKGNVSLLEGRCGEEPRVPADDDPLLFGQMASRIGAMTDFPAANIRVISNACISGVSAIVIARRMILSGVCDNAVVVGVDTQNRFITSGFASFKSLSDEVCRPYDASRCGLNLGEACGAILLTRNRLSGSDVAISGGAITDDANHISGPSRTGDGLYFAMRRAMGEAGVLSQQLDMLQMHGTATAYNDEMESKAASLAGLQDVPAQSLKPYFGHTMGASGVIETIIAAEELKRGVCAGTTGFSELGVPMPLNVSAANRGLAENAVRHCLKTASGFGGTNAAVALESGDSGDGEVGVPVDIDVRECREVVIGDGSVKVDGEVVFADENADYHAFIRDAFKAGGGQNMKFYKMDDFCKLAYVAADRLLECIDFGEEECGMVLSGRYGCLDTDMKHQQIIDSEGDAGASPAVFVYTLPNVAAGEVSIRHHIKGENTWFWSDDRQMRDIRQYAGMMMAAQDLKYCIIGYFDCIAGKYEAVFKLLERQN